jgi:hypothetical protein
MVFFYNHNYGGIFFGGMVRKWRDSFWVEMNEVI